MLHIDEMENKEIESHFQNMDFTLMPCPHCCDMRKDNNVPQCLFPLHMFVSHTAKGNKNDSAQVQDT